jgi:hypothetical protein
MIDDEKAKRKFEKIFKNKKTGKVITNIEEALVINPERTIAIFSKYVGELVSDSDRIPSKTKIPLLKGGKTLAVYQVDYLLQCLDLLKKLGREQVAVKMFVETDFPIEFVALDSYYDSYSAVKTHERILIAPRIEDGDSFREWTKNETKKGGIDETSVSEGGNRENSQ